MLIDPDSLDAVAVYRLMTSMIVPRPIAWVGTHDGSGSPTGDNLAPFSYFMGVSSRPPLLAISVARLKGGGLKHTARNILATKEFSVSIPSVADLDAMHATGAPWEQAEFDAVGIVRAPGERIRAPRPAQAACTLECVLHEALDLGSTHLIIGRVVMFVAAEGALHNGAVDITTLAPVARLGADAYAALGEIFERGRRTGGDGGLPK